MLVNAWINQPVATATNLHESGKNVFSAMNSSIAIRYAFSLEEIICQTESC